MHTNQRILVNALINAGYAIEVIDTDQELIEVSKDNKKHLILDRTSSKMSLLAAHLSASKIYAKKALNAAGVNTPEGKLFNINDPEEYQSAIKYGLSLSECVVKPNYGSHADNIYLQIRHKEHLSYVLDELLNKRINFCVIEKYIPFKEYRVFVTEKGKYACVHREPARVIGDGSSTIEELINKENTRRVNLRAQHYTSLCAIAYEDEETYYCLTEQNKSVQSVPRKDEIVYVRRHSNLAKGGRAVDMTSRISPEFANIAFKALSAIEGLNVAGVDILCEDPTVSNPNYVVLEINSNPGLAMHAFPDEGLAQPVGEYLMEILI